MRPGQNSASVLLFSGLISAGLLLQGGAVRAAAELKPWKSGATPPLILKDAAGTVHNLAALRGKVVLVNFWATWCEPCREEMPALLKLRQELGGAFEVLAVNLGESQEKAEGFLKTVLPPAATRSIRVHYDHDMGVARRWKARPPAGQLHHRTQRAHCLHAAG